ncbi:hypothetical protein MLD38_036075 [Melastoma candidum]|uniref:Uncharacterized protein n=1 Tax=Melastoma candidum TaxID=119954 RepID=A0ACB9LJR9_9MYRT|nr:hypothetical protein MLD38_036075 [Melastoma candidum]
MAASRPSRLLFAAVAVVLAVHASLSYAYADLDEDADMASLFALGFSSSGPECKGSVAECSVIRGEEEEEELVMDSEINRRILAATRYISYGALRRNAVPCSRRGVSYYNCRLGARVNPYVRGCSRITRCRG